MSACRTVSLALLIGLLSMGAGAARAETRRYAVVIGANAGDPREVRLHFAESDAAKVAQTLNDVGQFPAAQTLRLTGVSADEVRSALLELNARLRQETADTVLLVYYSGHADADNLHLAGTHLGTRELRDILAGSSAGSRVLILDACRSGAVTRVKGGTPTTPFAVNLGQSIPPAGLAILTSSAEGEDSQESDALSGSFFTHYFNSGLIGAADENHDGLVTLAEAFSFASEQTYRATVTTAAGPQHPTFRFELGGRQDLVLARPSRPHDGLGILRFEQSGRYVVQRVDAGGPRAVVAEIAATQPGSEVALPEGSYQVVLSQADYALESDAQVHDGDVETISAAHMRRSDYARLVRKGGAVATAYSLVLSGGMHTAPFSLQGVGPGSVYTSTWRQRNVGPAAALALRRDSRRFSLEARLGYGTDHLENDGQIALDTQMFTAGATGLAAWDLGPITFDAGVEVGLLAIRQRTTEWTAVYPFTSPGPRPSLDLPGQLGTSWALGPSVGPVLQANVRLWRRVFAQLEGRLPFALMNVKSAPDASDWQWSRRLEVMVGIGCYL